jgi:MoxR-like ATPase
MPAKLLGLTGEEYFSYQLNAFTTPDEIDGPISVRALTEEDQVVRITDHKLPRAVFAYLDEVFEAGSATRKSILSQLNERLHYNPGPTPIPLSTCVASANLLPDEPASQAFVDRFLSWFEVRDLQHPSSVVDMLMAEDHPVEQVMNWGDVLRAQQLVAQVKVPRQVAEQLAAMRENLNRHNVYPSPRRFKESLGLLRAEAWLRGRDEVVVSDLRVLRNTWTRLEDIDIVQRVALESASDLDRRSLDLQHEANGLLQETQALCDADNKGEVQWKAQAIELGTKLSRFELDLNELDQAYSEEGEPSPVFEELDRLGTYISNLANKGIYSLYASPRRRRRNG